MPGQTTIAAMMNLHPCVLQWRAGQLPGQTRPGPQPALGALPASMEGRAIARPNPDTEEGPVTDEKLQWRAGQLPGQTCGRLMALWRSRRLQWRAGQLPGQTPPVPARSCAPVTRFNGGPGNCPAKPRVV